VVKVDTWYLIGRVQREMRVFRVSRLQTLAASGETFARDADFDLQKFWKRWCERFESNPPPRSFAVEVNISARGRQHLLDSFGTWLRPRLEPLGDRFRGRKPVTLEFDREDVALRVLFEVGGEVEIVKPKSLQRKLYAQAAKIVGAAARDH
jgi:predicted DNA-binding transcriptional regulator YafY